MFSRDMWHIEIFTHLEAMNYVVDHVGESA